METPKIFESEYRFCQILWDNEPVRSSELVRLCQEILGWKQSTTYTVIKRLSQRGVLQNEHSIPSFLAAFTDSHALSKEDLDDIQKMIDTIRKGR